MRLGFRWLSAAQTTHNQGGQDWTERRRDVLLKQPPRILLSGLAAGALSVLAYGLVLWAQTRSELAPIAALRETSVIFGAIISTLIFREPFGRTRIAATVLVVAGIVLLNVG